MRGRTEISQNLALKKIRVKTIKSCILEFQINPTGVVVSRIFRRLHPEVEGVRAVVSKRGVDDGNQKGGGSLQPAKEN